MTKRIEKVNELVKEVVSDIVHRSLQFPDGVLVTITRVAASPDFHYANIFFTVFSKKGGAEEAGIGGIFNRNTRAIQHELNRKLRMRPVPRIVFLADKEETRRETVERLLGGMASP